MFGISWTELVLIALVALVVVGPKDLPKVLAILGRFMRHARAFVYRFQEEIDEILTDAEVKEFKQETLKDYVHKKGKK